MEKLWNELKIQISDFELKPEIILNNGATQKEIEETELFLNVELPIDYKDFMKIHNGQNSSESWLIYNHEFLSLERLKDEWSIWKKLLDKKAFERNGLSIKSKPDVGIQDFWWTPEWIPITYEGAGNHYCIDLVPDKQGNKGQIFKMYHDDNRRILIANNFTEFIEKYIYELKTGRFNIEY